MPSEFQVIVLEGTHEGDVVTYYSHEEPEIVKRETESFVCFVPRNGLVSRVNRLNEIPLGRVLGIVHPKPEEIIDP